MSRSTDDADLHLRAQEELASMALGESVPAGVEQHVRACPECREELAQLVRVVALAREGGRDSEERSPTAQAQTWAHIAALTGAPAEPVAGAGPAASGVPAEPLRPARRGWRRAGLAAAAVVALVAAGLGGWAVGHTSSPGTAQHAAVAELSAQPGTTARAAGTATMHPDGRGYAMEVRTSGLPAPTGYYEVWLYDPSAGDMVAVGTLGPGARGTFTLPDGIDVARYRVVDVSAQRYNGDPRHQRSVLQGPLDR